MENVENKDVEMKEKDNSEKMSAPVDVVEDKLFTKITVNQLTQNEGLGKVLYKILTLCHLSRTVSPKVITWVKLVESITKKEFEELTTIQKNFDFQINNRDFRNDDKLKQGFAIQEQGKMAKKLTSLIDVPMIDETLLKVQINLADAEFSQLVPFFFSAGFPVKDIDIVAVVNE